MNQLWPPFDNAAIRRAMLKGIDQKEFMEAVAGDDPKMWHVPTGIFCPGLPMASDAGLQVFEGPRDYAAVKKEIAAAGAGDGGAEEDRGGDTVTGIAGRPVYSNGSEFL